MIRVSALCGIIVVAGLGPAVVAAAKPIPHYHLAREVSLAGNDGWDYLSFDRARARIFIAHGTRVQVVDAHSYAVVGEIADTPGVHGIALAPDLGRGYISAGRADTIVVFDLRTLARLREIKPTGAGPDAIVYEPLSHRIVSLNGRGRSATVIDARTDTVVGTIPLDAKPEFAVADGKGNIYVNLEDRNSIGVIDPQKLTLQQTWPIAGCREPSGLAMDRTRHRLFSVCGNRIMAVLDSSVGRLITTLPIGSHVDAAAFDSGTGLAFASNGDGTLTVVREISPEEFRVVQTVETKEGARTLTLDEGNHHLYSVTAKFGELPAAAGKAAPGRPPIEPGTFVLLVVEP
jgi:DNA-binding beta-propeller fold protein YncE